MSPWALQRVAHALREGAVIAYPTDTIWGFGCHPLHAQAIRRLLSIKQRSSGKGLILLSSRLDLCRGYIDAGDETALAEQLSNPSTSPVTWIVKAHPHCPQWLTGGRDTIAVRITDKPLINNLCRGLQSPLVSTSANLSGRPHARNRLLIQRYFGQVVDFIVEDWQQHSALNARNRPSIIRRLHSGDILRA